MFSKNLVIEAWSAKRKLQTDGSTDDVLLDGNVVSMSSEKWSLLANGTLVVAAVTIVGSDITKSKIFSPLVGCNTN